MALYKIADPVLIRNAKIAVDIRPGDVIITGNRPEISSVRAFAGDDNVGLEYFGGVYEGVADGSLSKGDECYYNSTTGKVTKTAAGAYHLGVVLFAPADCADGSEIKILHFPNGTQLGANASVTPAAAVTPTQETLTDSTGGTAGTTLAAPASTDYTTAELKNVIASLAAQLAKAKADVTAIISALQAADLMATAEAEAEGEGG